MEINAKIISIKTVSLIFGEFRVEKGSFVHEFSFGPGETTSMLGADLSGEYDITITDGSSYEVEIIDDGN